MFGVSPLRKSAVNFIQKSGFATEKQLKNRIVATTNISKITKSMKMVSAAKFRGDQQRLTAANAFAGWANDITGKPAPLEDHNPEKFPENNLFVVMSTDKGLCGGVNSILTRLTKALFNKLSNKTPPLYVLGEKGKLQLRRVYADNLVGAATEREMPYTFDLAINITEALLNEKADAIHLIYNQFKSAIVYIPNIKTITPLTDPNNPFLYPYDVDPSNDPETLQNFYEFTLATQVYQSMLDNACSEQSSRMTAMENASKNAGEMINKLTLNYNRARQSRITTELIEIISGASALKANN
jgi:F-type H+-transporting ATPase subunit gamma